ncbi:unnamed protein product [Rotaria magnacalcarata]|uniref:Uncharacterized protein n=2 Tax=Rotaria magnacalcarata TaxID=392030 RepID=A0A8S3AZS7_9BILA|nr:unnamed protein product [Rotaria magnacalcarata]
MDLVNVAKYILHLTENNFGCANDVYRNSYFNEIHSYETLNFNDEFDDMYDEREIDSEDDDYVKNQYVEMSSNFTVEEMENTIECIDEHPNYSFSTIQHRLQTIKSINCIPRFRQYIEWTGTRHEKLEKIKEFMFDEFYVKRAIEKEAVHDTD